MKNNMETAGIYIRKSRESDNGEAFRLSMQREDLPKYAENKGWLYKIYDEGITSGGKISDRPLMQNLLSDVQHNIINVILVIDISRLSRDTLYEDAVKILSTCVRHKCKIATRDYVYDTANRMQANFLLQSLGFAGLEMGLILDRMKEGKKKRIDKGYAFNGGIAPFGYMFNGKIVINENEAKIVKLVFEHYEMGAIALTDYLNNRHFKLRTGGSFQYRDIARIRKRLYYAGKTRNNENKIIDCVDIPKIIDYDLWLKNQESIKSRNTGDHSRKGKYLLIGLARCGFCGDRITSLSGKKYSYTNGKRYTRKSDNNTYYCYSKRRGKSMCRSSKYLSMRIIDKLIIDDFISHFKDENYLKKCYADYKKKSLMDCNVNIVEIQGKIKKLKENQKRLIDHKLKGVAEDISEMELHQTDKMIDKIEIEIRDLELISEKRGKKKPYILTIEMFIRSIKAIEQIRAESYTENIEAYRLHLATYVDKILIRNKTIEITYKYFPKSVIKYNYKELLSIHKPVVLSS